MAIPTGTPTYRSPGSHIGADAQVTFTVDSRGYSYAMSREVFQDSKPGLEITGGIGPKLAFPTEFGFVPLGTVTVTIRNQSALLLLDASDIIGATVTLSTVLIFWDSSVLNKQRKDYSMIISRAQAIANGVRLTLKQVEDSRLLQMYPRFVYNATDWPELFEDHSNRPVVVVTGTGIKVPCTLIETNSGVGPWKFAVCQPSTATILTVYRNNRIVPAVEYISSTETTSTYTVRTIEFTNEPIDFSGNYYDITVDVQNTIDNRTPSAEIKRLFDEVGITVDTSSFTTAQSDLTTIGILVDFAHGRNEKQRTLKSIIEELLFISRAALFRNSNGFAISIDKVQAYNFEYNEDIGELVDVQTFERPESPTTVVVEYRPLIQDPDKLSSRVSRTVVEGSGAEKIYKLPMIRDHLVADKAVEYLAARFQFNRTATVKLSTFLVNLQDTDRLISSKILATPLNAIAWSIQYTLDGSTVTYREYDSTVYDYIGGTLPLDPGTGYEPDYSETRPDTPVIIFGGDTGVGPNTDEFREYSTPNEDGSAWSAWRMSCRQAATETSNYDTMKFWAVATDTGEQILGVPTETEYTISSSNIASNLFTPAPHDLLIGDAVLYTEEGGSVIGLTDNTIYYVSFSTAFDATEIGLSTDDSDAEAGTLITISTNVVGDIKLRLVDATNSSLSARACTFQSLRPNTSYTFKCAAVNKFGIESIPVTLADTAATFGTAPGVPTGAVGSTQGVGETVHISWTTPAGVDNIKHYEIERNVGGGGFSLLTTVLGTSFVDDTVTYTNTYDYQVRTVDTFDNVSTFLAFGSTTVNRNIGSTTDVHIGNDNLLNNLREPIDSDAHSFSSNTSGTTPHQVRFKFSSGNVAHGFANEPLISWEGERFIFISLIGFGFGLSRSIDSTNYAFELFLQITSVSATSNTYNTVAGFW